MLKNHRTRSYEVHHRQRRILSLQRVLNHHTLDLVRSGEVLNFPISQLTHECRLPRPVCAKDTITASAEQSELGVREKEKGTVSQGEEGITEGFAFVRVVDRGDVVLRLQ